MSLKQPQLSDGDITTVVIDELDPHPRNQEIYVNPDISDIVSHIEEHGFKDEHRLLVTPEGRILSGHRRWRAAKEVGLDDIEVEVTAVDDEHEELERLLLANQYRDKTAAEKVLEAQAWREYYESDTSIDLCSSQKIDNKVAKKVEIGSASIERGRKVMEIATGERHAPKEVRKEAKRQWEKMKLSGDNAQSINGGYKQVSIKEASVENRKQKTVSVEKQSAPLIKEGDGIRALEKVSPDLLLTDPPYSTAIEDVHEFAHSWIPTAVESIGESGKGFIFIGAYAEELQAYLNALSSAGVIERVQPLVWTYRNTLGKTPGAQYKLNWQAVLFIQSSPPIQIDSPLTKEQWAVQDVNAPDARFEDRKHQWQKPSKLINRFIRHTSDKGDLVFDPFVGTGTTVLEAAELGRETLGVDNDPEMLAIAEERGCLRKDE